MTNILIVGQKELAANPIFKQDKNMLETYNDLKDNNNVEILFLNKDIKLNMEEKESERENENIKQEEIINAKQFCIRDMMKKGLLKKNLNNFIKEHNVKTIIFMSNHMAKLVMPYIESLLNGLNIICDFRLTNISYILQQYKYEKEKDEPNFYGLNKSFKIHFIQLLSIFKYTNYVVLDEDSDNYLLENQNIKNIILPAQIKNYVESNSENYNKVTKHTVCEISISRNNYCSNLHSVNVVQECEYSKKYSVTENKNFNLIDDINNIIKSNKFDYFFIHNDKVRLMLPNTVHLIADYLSFNDNCALATPNVSSYFRDINNLKFCFDNHRFNNFSNWYEDKPLNFSDSVVIKKKFFNKVGMFDNKFKTFDYALFDFILRLYQAKFYCFRMGDISMFRPSSVSHQISLLDEDKRLLCEKWGEFSFDLGIC